NGMSIAPNVGAVSRMLEALRTAQPYRGAKHIGRQVLEHMPGGELAEEARRRIFTSLKALFIPNILFEQFGFTYFGPVDGHDLFAVESVLEKARDFGDGPVFVHVQTQKGHGYGPAEDDNVKWHGVSATGAAKPTAPQYTAVFADSVREVLKADQRAVAITAAMPGGGIVGDDGRTHQGLYDTAFLRILPGMTLMAPKDEAELRQMVWTAYRHAAAGRGPIGVRFPRGTGVGVALDAPLAEIPMGVSETLRDGDGVAILAYGHPVAAAVEAAAILARDGLEATVINARFAQPLDVERILAL